MNTGSTTRLRFELEWRTTLFALVLVPLMTGLGFWQLQRADEKRALADAFAVREAQPPASLGQLWQARAEALAYLPVRLRGSFVPGALVLLDNRTRDGKFGFEALGVVALSGGGFALVNRGWVAGDPARRELPAVADVAGELDLTGHLYVPPGEPYLLAEQQFAEQWPMVLQALEMDKLAPALARRLGDRVFPYSVRLDANAPGALAVEWQVINVSPQKHLGYAVQWFTMAAVLFLFFVFRSTNLWQLLRRRETGK